jgi:hypothetical protein
MRENHTFVFVSQRVQRDFVPGLSGRGDRMWLWWRDDSVGMIQHKVLEHLIPGGGGSQSMMEAFTAATLAEGGGEGGCHFTRDPPADFCPPRRFLRKRLVTHPHML